MAEPVHHVLARSNASLKDKIARIRQKGAKHVGRGVRTLETAAGAAIAGVLQGMSKDPNGPHIFHMPADLVIGLGLNVAGHAGLADGYDEHLCSFGDGFIAAYFTEAGYVIGKRKRDSGSFFHKGGALGAPAAQPGLPGGAPAVHGEVSPHQVADAILAQMPR